MGRFLQSDANPGKYVYQDDKGVITQAKKLRANDTGKMFLRSEGGEMKELVAPGAPAPANMSDGMPPGAPIASNDPSVPSMNFNDPGYAEATTRPDTSLAPMPWAAIPGKMVSNAIPSTGKVISDTVQPFMQPVDTAKLMGSILLGVARKSGMDIGDPNDVKVADAVGRYYGERLGGLEEIKRTAANDPAGLLMDFASIASLGAGALARAPGQMGKIGRSVGKVANVADPVSLAMKTAGWVANPKATGAASRLVAQGVHPTIGQTLGGIAKRTEDALESVWGLGSVIKAGRNRANQQLNRAAYNRALEPIGENAKGLTPGASGISDVSDKLSAAYNTLLPKVTLVVDGQLLGDITSAVNNAKNIIDSNAGAMLEKIVGVKIMERLSKGDVPGAELKMMQEDVGALATKMKVGSASERIAGEALDSIQDAIRKALARTNPEHAAELKAIDTGYANYVRLRAAGGASGAEISGFTPAQLRAGVKAADKSVGKGDTARGRSLMQDLSMDARSVMGDNLANSGSIDRAMTAGLATGAYAVDPIVAATLAAASTAYMPGIQGGLAKLLAGSRPGAVRATGDALSRYGPRVGRAAYQGGRLQEDLRRKGY